MNDWYKSSILHYRASYFCLRMCFFLNFAMYLKCNSFFIALHHPLPKSNVAGGSSIQIIIIIIQIRHERVGYFSFIITNCCIAVVIDSNLISQAKRYFFFQFLVLFISPPLSPSFGIQFQPYLSYYYYYYYFSCFSLWHLLRAQCQTHKHE